MEKFLIFLMFLQASQSLTIIQNPSNTSALVGDDVTLTCETSDEGNQDAVEWIEYVTIPVGQRIWVSTDDPGDIGHEDEGNKFEIVGTYNLKINNIGLEYGGKYGCKLLVADDSPRVAFASVFERAECANMGEDLHEYDMAYISCHVSYGSEVPPDVYFYDDGEKMSIDYERGDNYIYISANITAMAEDDGNLFECRVNISNPAYQDSCTTSLSIKYTARNLTFVPHYAQYYSGDRVECVAKGNPTPLIEWEKVESDGSEDNIDGTFLDVTADMVGSNVWACSVENTVEGNTTYLREEIMFEVLAGSTEIVVDSSRRTLAEFVVVFLSVTLSFAI